MERVDITIIGAGVVGLAIARYLADSHRSVVVLEKHPTFGQETSSRNSEVIHSGIYYPTGSLKTLLCVAGNSMIYRYCEKHNIAHTRLGKIIVATNSFEIIHLEKLYETGKKNGVNELQWLEQNQIQQLEPQVRCLAGLLSPNTGILDSHAFMKSLAQEAQAQDAMFAYGAKVEKIQRRRDGYRIWQTSNEAYLYVGIL